MDQWLNPNTKTWNTAVKLAPNRWLCADSTVMPSLTHQHKQSHKKTALDCIVKLRYPQYCFGNLRCPFFLFQLCNLLTQLSIDRKERHFGRDTIPTGARNSAR